MIEDGVTLTFDPTDRPTPGTECAECRKAGHFCPAKGMAGEVALCLACGTGEPCGQAVAVEKFTSGQQYAEFEVEKAPSECRQIAIEAADRVVVEKPLEHAWAMRDQLNPANLLKPKRVKVKKEAKPKAARRSLATRQVREKVEPVKLPPPRFLPIAARPEEPTIHVPQPKEEAVMPVKVQKMEITAAKAKAQEMTKAGLSIHQVTKVVGYSWASVAYWLRGESVKKVKAAELVKPPKKSGNGREVVVSDKIQHVVRGEVAMEQELPDTISLKAPISALDRFWERLSIPDKTRIVERELFGGL